MTRKPEQGGLSGSCRGMQELLLRDLDAELNAGERERLADHLAACASCAAEKAALERSLALLARRQAPVPDAAYWTSLQREVRRALGEAQEKRARRWLGQPRAWAPYAAAALAALILALGWWARRPAPLNTEGAMPLASLEAAAQRDLHDLEGSLGEFDALALAQMPGDSLARLLAELAPSTGEVAALFLPESASGEDIAWGEAADEALAENMAVEELIGLLTGSELEALSSRLTNMAG